MFIDEEKVEETPVEETPSVDEATESPAEQVWVFIYK